MKKRAVRHWAKHLRGSIKKEVNKPLDHVYFNGKALSVHVSWLRNENRIKALMKRLLPDGEYYALAYTGRKSPYHCGLTKHLFRCERRTIEGRGGFSDKVTVHVWDTKRLSHYWFWRNRWKQYAGPHRRYGVGVDLLRKAAPEFYEEPIENHVRVVE